MEKILYLLRHAKSSWDSDAVSDLDRPLSERGRVNALALGQWLAGQGDGVRPDLILLSPALRARETADRVIGATAWRDLVVKTDETLYLADLETLLAVLRKTPADCRNLMLVGHNPGLEDLVVHLAKVKSDLPWTKKGKLVTTGNLVRMVLGDCWSSVQGGSGALDWLVRPKELPT